MFKMNTADFEHNNLVESAILNWLDCGGLGTKVCGGLLAEAGPKPKGQFGGDAGKRKEGWGKCVGADAFIPLEMKEEAQNLIKTCMR